MDETKKIYAAAGQAQESGPLHHINPASSTLLKERYKEIFLITRQIEFKAILNFHFGPMGYRVTHTSEPLTIVERLEKLDKEGWPFPDAIIFNTLDFPRHWKPLLKVVRERKSHAECLFILLGTPDFHFDEAAKAAFLEANAILIEDFYHKKTITQLYEIIKRYKTIEDKRKYIRYIPRQIERFKFLFTHPVHKYLVSCNVADISLAGACIKPLDPALIADLRVNQSLTSCSLRVAEDILTVNCRIAFAGKELGLEFESLESKGHQRLFHYLMEVPKRAMEEQI